MDRCNKSGESSQRRERDRRERVSRQKIKVHEKDKKIEKSRGTAFSNVL